ncbi:MAG: glycine oxidase ThiO [Vicinamibacterales bacterium]
MSDVLVIGAGVVGCAAAFELAEAGATVRVVDARVPGAGASQASAGVLAPSIEGHGSPVLRALGRRSLDLYPAFVERVAAASGQAVEFQRLGTLEVAVTPEERDRLERPSPELAAEGVDSQWLDAAALADREPHLGGHVLGGRLMPAHAAVHVPALTAALVAALARRGIEVATGVAVTRLSADGDEVVVHAGETALRARHVVMAVGSWAAGLVPPGCSPLPVRPIRGQLLHLAAPPGTLRHVVWGADVYLVPWADGTIFAGATSEDVGFDERTTASGVAGLLDAAIALVPGLAGASFLEARRGLRPASPDELPYVGPSAVIPGLVYACGHYRNGALLAPLTAALVAGVVTGAPPDAALTALTPARAGRL